jgi:hypothetical protein
MNNLFFKIVLVSALVEAKTVENIHTRRSFLTEVLDWYCTTGLSQTVFSTLCVKEKLTRKELNHTERLEMKGAKFVFCNTTEQKSLNANTRCQNLAEKPGSNNISKFLIDPQIKRTRQNLTV